MMKKYKLIKDLPFIKKGVIYFKDIDGIKHERFAIHSDYVENNPEFWEEVVEKDYVILKFSIGKNVYQRQNNGEPYYNINGRMYFERIHENNIPKNIDKIISIKRLSDGEVFNVGDRVKYYKSIGILDKFYFNGHGQLSFFIKGVNAPATGVFPSNFLEKTKVLFRTEDGVDIYEDERIDFVYKVTPSFELSIINTFKFKINKNCKYFSTKKAAENYIKMHKPVLSYNEVLDIYDKMTLVLDILDRKEFKYQLEKLVKSKL